MAAEVQITAEKLLKEAKDRKLEKAPNPPKQPITEEQELKDLQFTNVG